MALTIEGATIGFDKDNIKTALTNLKTSAIDETKSTMDSRTSEIETWVSDVWIGDSADQFLKNMETDKQNVKKGLDDAYEKLEQRLNKIATEMDDADESIVTER